MRKGYGRISEKILNIHEIGLERDGNDLVFILVDDEYSFELSKNPLLYQIFL
jgi:hypothetical protein